MRYNDPSGHTEEEITSDFHDISDAEEFLEMIRAVLWLAEYPYDTDLDFFLGIGVNDGGPEVAEVIAKLVGLEPTVLGWAATFVAAGIDEANQEGLKTLRRFRDDLVEAIASWQQSSSETMYMELSIFNAGFLKADAYNISLRDTVELTAEEQKTRWFNYRTETRTIENWHNLAGGPLAGSLNNFAKVTRDLMINYVPESGGVVQYHRKGQNYSLIYE